MTFIINQDLVYSTLGVPKAAMTIHDHQDMDIEDFRDSNGNILTNTARVVDVGSDQIAKWTTIHKNGLYNDKIHCPPTYKNCPVRGIKLVTGHCKTKGADGAGKKTIRAIEVEFHDYNGVSAADWEQIARSNENRPLEDREDFVKNDRDDASIVNTLKQMKDNIQFTIINENGEKEPTDKFLNKRLDILKIPSSQWPKYRDLLYDELGVNPDCIVGRTVTGDKSSVEKFQKDVKKTWRNKKILFKTLDATGGGSVKMTIELTRMVVDEFLTGEPYDMVVVKHTRQKTIKQMEKARVRDRKFFTNLTGQFQKDLKRFSEVCGGNVPDGPWPEVKFEPQTDIQIKEWNEKGELV